MRNENSAAITGITLATPSEKQVKGLELRYIGSLQKVILSIWTEISKTVKNISSSRNEVKMYESLCWIWRKNDEIILVSSEVWRIEKTDQEQKSKEKKMWKKRKMKAVYRNYIQRPGSPNADLVESGQQCQKQKKAIIFIKDK